MTDRFCGCNATASNVNQGRRAHCSGSQTLYFGLLVDISAAHRRRRLYVSGTGAEDAKKRRDVDGVEWARSSGLSPNQPTRGSGERRELPSGGIFWQLELEWTHLTDN